MGAGNPTISRETETQVPAAYQPQPRQPHIIKLISQLQKPTRKISDTWIIDTDKRETRYQLVKAHQTIQRPHRHITWMSSNLTNLHSIDVSLQMVSGLITFWIFIAVKLTHFARCLQEGLTCIENSLLFSLLLLYLDRVPLSPGHWQRCAQNKGHMILMPTALPMML